MKLNELVTFFVVLGYASELFAAGIDDLYGNKDCCGL